MARSVRPGRPYLPTLFALTMLIGACLLFVVQPMIAKMVLPLLGGSPAVWNTCMVFFQGALLAGYAYAHAVNSYLGTRRQVALHAGLLLLPLFFLPFGIPADWVRSMPSGTNPSPWLLSLLLVMVGLPFLVVSTTAPLLQRWFSGTGHPTAGDPYFLYGASNLGSMLGLLGYPLLIEPNLTLSRQSELWAAGYGLLVVMILACSATAWWSGRGVRRGPGLVSEEVPSESPGVGRWVRWVALAFIPSSLMLGVTSYLTTDIAAVPLLWVIPLALYLLSFILVFARRPIVPHPWMVRLLPVVAVLLTVAMSLKTVQPIFIPIHLLTFFVVAMVCHGELVKYRPSARHLTAFYLAMSLGGVLGGIFNALIAPIAFNWVAEYPLALVLGCAAMPVAGPGARRPVDRVLDLVIPVSIGLLTAGMLSVFPPLTESSAGDIGPKLVVGVAAFACFTFKDVPVRFALTIGAILLASEVTDRIHGHVLHQERNFFGVLRISHDDRRNAHKLIHGNTLHGVQSLDPDRRREPLTYYHRAGPVGQVFEVFAARPARPDVAVVGLGAGTLACYAESGQRWTFYEIDPAVVRIARDPRYFTYLRDGLATTCDVILGDARVRLRDAPEHMYGLIVLDAFSSDSIPVHLLTRESLQLYRGKLADGGLLAFHISNRFIDLAPVLGALARDAGLVARVRYDLALTREEESDGKLGSSWVVMAAREADIGILATDTKWEEPRSRPDDVVWTDQFSNIITHLVFTKK